MKTPSSRATLFSKFKLVLVIVLLFTGINACKKDLKPFVGANSASIWAIDRLAAADKVSSAEMLNWQATAVPGGLPYKIDWTGAQQAVINNKHVIKIPLGRSAALFFTKDSGKLLVYAYKWLDEKPGAKLFSGKIASFSFQDHNMRTMVYSNGQLTATYAQPVTTASSKIAINSQGTKLKTNDIISDIGTAISKAWCFITGGSWGYTDNNYGSYIGGCFYDDDDEEEETQSTISNNDWIDYWAYAGSGIPGVVIGSLDSGGGAAWVSQWVPDGCPTGPDAPGGGYTGIDDSGGGPGSCSGTNGHWETFTVEIPPETNSFLITRDSSITNNHRLDSIFVNLLTKNQVFDSLSRVYRASHTYDITYKVGQLGSNALGYTEFWPMTQNGQPYGAKVITTLNRSFVNSDLQTKFVNIVRTTLHETWHAELDYLLKSIYNVNDLTVIQQHYNIASIHDLTIHQLIDLLAVDQNNHVILGSSTITANTTWSQLEQHNYMVKNINVLAKGINQFLISIQSPLANNKEFIYAEALSTLMPVSTYFQDTTNQTSFYQYFQGYTPGGAQSLLQYINSVYTNNINNLGPLR